MVTIVTNNMLNDSYSFSDDLIFMLVYVNVYIGSRTSDDSGCGRDGYIIIETNFRLCAYTS